jgi:hypothetical protein
MWARRGPTKAIQFRNKVVLKENPAEMWGRKGSSQFSVVGSQPATDTRLLTADN